MQMQLQRVIVPNIFQKDALERLEITTENRGIIVMPTGTGKTFLAALWFKKKLENNPNAKLLFICHNKDILSQANEMEFQKCLRDFNIKFSYYNADEKEIEQCTFGTVQTLFRNLKKFSKDYFDYIIVDEAHHYQAKTFKVVAKYFTPKFLLGLTATPYRMDQKDIMEVCGNIIYNAKTSTAIKLGLLTKINYYCVDNDIDFSNVRWNGSNYDEKDLNRKICIKEYDNAILQEYLKTVIGKFKKTKTICFSATVEHAHRMAKVFNDNDISAVALTGKYPVKSRITLHENRRNDIIADFRNGKYQVIFVRDLFNEGVDIPDADCIMMLRPTQSHTIFTQQIGRGLRTSEGKDDVLVLDFTGNCRRCVINFEVLGEMIELDIIKKIKSEDGQKNEIVFLNNGSSVRLTKKKVNIVKMNFYIEEKYSLENLKRLFYVLKTRFGKNFNYIKFLRFGHLSSEKISDIYGGWNKFQKIIGEKPMKKDDTTREELINTYKKIKEKLGKTPMLKELPPNQFSRYSLAKYFGTYYKFLKEMEDEHPTRNIEGKSNKITKEYLIKKYYELKSKLGRAPLMHEVNSNGEYHTYLFGSWNNFLRSIGEPINVNKDKVSRNELIKEYFRAKKKIGKQLLGTYFKHNKKYGIKYNLDKYYSEFGGWKKFLIAINEQLNQNNVYAKEVTKKNLIKNYYNLKKKLGRDVLTYDIKTFKGSKYGMGKYYSKFGSWANFRKEIGEPKYKRVTTKYLIKDFLSVKKRFGRIPKASEWKLHRLATERFGSYHNFLKKVKIDSKECYEGTLCYGNQFLTKQDMFKEYTRIKHILNRIPVTTDFRYKNKQTKFGRKLIINRFGRFLIFRNKAEKWLKENSDISPKQNIKIIPDYKPKTELTIPIKRRDSFDGKSHIGKGWKDYGYKTTIEKINIREKIIEKIRDGDVVLLLESPELSALKEIEKQNKKPSKIIIPNNLEFSKVAEALNNFKTTLNIELVNTSVLQYLIDSEEKFDFIWLDYCGAFSYYMKDLDILFQKHFKDIRLVLSYNLFDPIKEDDSYYFTRVIDYVLGKISGQNKIRLLNDITYRYKKTMYNIGFDIEPLSKSHISK